MLISRFIEVPGLIFVIGSFFAFFSAFISNFARDPYVHITIGILSFIFGYIMLRKPKVPESHIALLKHSLEKSEDPIADYQVISESSGAPGFFNNLGITGLPLATVTITILFCLLAIMSYGINAIGNAPIIPEDFPKLVLELSKLTLGAFIGSFVAKAEPLKRASKKAPNKTNSTE